MNNKTILKMEKIRKVFPGVTALDNVSMDFREGEIHAICGENGAGKSTFIKILTGAILPTEGSILIDGKKHFGFSPQQALFDLKIGAIYQEFNLFPYLTVAENIFFGKEIHKNNFLDKKEMHRRTAELLSRLDIDLDTSQKVENLSVAYQQIVEIAKSLAMNLRVLIMDEPSAPLTERELIQLYKIVRTLKEQGVTIIYISHLLEEALDMADRISVLRDGQYITTVNASEITKDELVSHMVGRTIDSNYPRKEEKPGKVLLQVKDLSDSKKLKDINFCLHEGEILGIGGLVGAGRTRLARTIFGATRSRTGTIIKNGKTITNNSPTQGMKNGIGLIPEDRKQHGILAELSVKENISFSSLKKLSRQIFIDSRREVDETISFIKRLNIKTPGHEQLVKNLSGGNQQKVVLAKWLSTNCDVLIFDEPTRGIDVGAKYEIYELILELSRQGKGIIIISSEMPELIGMSERILVMREGRIVKEFKREESSQEAIIHAAS